MIYICHEKWDIFSVPLELLYMQREDNFMATWV